MQRLRGTGCVPFFCLGGDRELVFLARSLVTGWQDSEPSCAGGMHFRFLSVPFFPYRSACVSFSFYSTYFESPSISIRVISSGAYRSEYVWAPTPPLFLGWLGNGWFRREHTAQPLVQPPHIYIKEQMRWIQSRCRARQTFNDTSRKKISFWLHALTFIPLSMISDFHVWSLITHIQA